MGWLVRYTGDPGTVDVPGLGPAEVQTGDTFDLRPPDAVRLVTDPTAPWERIKPGMPDYVAPEDRS